MTQVKNRIFNSHITLRFQQNRSVSKHGGSFGIFRTLYASVVKQPMSKGNTVSNFVLSRTLLLSNPLLCGVIFINPSSTIDSALLSNLQSALVSKLRLKPSVTSPLDRLEPSSQQL
ncbi:hypothetical protein LR48_Vigan11g117700 [Vigna angularis]|uniref:Uncharacterized protein n=1 Tax=Phaseolus angularis TaxID=3914 RepID=A0A0L9VT69_PHAAN|nr:hypothetical protein LR48_Vigan11g117700 [Vigna angularis]